MSNTSIGKRIRFYRESKKWSQEVFAEKLGLSLTYVGMIERGEKIPKLETFIKIANTLRLAGTSNEVIEEIMKNVTINKDDEINNDLWNKIYDYVRVRYPAYKTQSGITITGIKIYESRD